jgi:hypothetical protein
MPAARAHAPRALRLAPTPGGGGFWLVGSDGSVFSFGDAGYEGSLPGIGLHVDNVVGMAAESSPV